MAQYSLCEIRDNHPNGDGQYFQNLGWTTLKGESVVFPTFSSFSKKFYDINSGALSDFVVSSGVRNVTVSPNPSRNAEISFPNGITIYTLQSIEYAGIRIIEADHIEIDTYLTFSNGTKFNVLFSCKKN